MSKCSHKNLTIDRYCNDCGYDLIVDDREDTIRQREQERIIKLIMDNAHPKGTIGEMLQDNYVLQLSECQEAAELLITLIKGEQ